MTKISEIKEYYILDFSFTYKIFFPYSMVQERKQLKLTISSIQILLQLMSVANNLIIRVELFH